MGALSIWHILLVGIVLLLLFGGKFKVSDTMGDFAKGIKAFKDGLKDEDEAKKAPAKVETQAEAPKPEASKDEPKA